MIYLNFACTVLPASFETYDLNNIPQKNTLTTPTVSLESQLQQAVSSRDIHKIHQALALGADPNIQIDLGIGWERPILHWSVYHAYPEIMKILLNSEKIKPNMRDDEGKTPLEIIAYELIPIRVKDDLVYEATKMLLMHPKIKIPDNVLTDSKTMNVINLALENGWKEEGLSEKPEHIKELQEYIKRAQARIASRKTNMDID
jgi:hypothetical protein